MKLKLDIKGKENRIFVDGKTLNQIAEESGVKLETVQHRYSRGVHDYDGLTKQSHINNEHKRLQKKSYCIMSASEKVMEEIWKQDIPLIEVCRRTGIGTSTLYSFLYNGTDISSMRLAKICKCLGLSMDAVMGI